MYQVGYLLCHRDCEYVLVQSRTITLDGNQAYTQVSSKNKRLYVGV